MSFSISTPETKRLRTLKELRIIDTVAEQDFDDIVTLAARICNVPIAAISLIDADRQWFKAKIGLDVSETPSEMAFCSHTIAGTGLFIVPNALEDEVFADNPLVIGEPHIRFYAGAPLAIDGVNAVGSLCVIDRVPRQLSPEQLESLEFLARQVVKLFTLRRQASELTQANRLLKLEITERRTIEQVLRLHNQVIATVSEGIVITRGAPDNEIAYVNESFERMTGYASKEVVGRNCRFMQGAETDPATVAVIREAIKKQEFCSVEILNYRKDGTAFWNALSISPVKDEAGRVTHFVGVQQDITERRQAVEKLLYSEERYRFLLESIPQQVWTALPKGRIDYTNIRTSEYFGKKTQDELVETRWADVFHPEDLAESSEVWKRAIETGEVYEREHRLRRFDGVYRWHLSQAIPMLGENGKTIVKWFGTNTDIHDRKTAEEANRQIAEYRNLFQTANDAILIFEPETNKILDVNEKACQMYGINRTHFLGRNIKELLRSNQHGETMMKSLIETGDSHSFETVHYQADGTPIDLVINASIIEYQGRKLVLSINRDVTERKRTEEKLLHNALHDVLTNLPNRALFLEHLRHAIEHYHTHEKNPFAVLFLDFDHFKVVNDSLGHMEGDNLLKLFAQRLIECLRPGDILARLGGDEFTILLRDLNSIDSVTQIAERIQNELKSPFTLNGSEVFTSVSIGIALSNQKYEKPEDILRDADVAMYRAKVGGKARHQIFDQAMHEQANARLRLETELRHALHRGEFCLYFQPIIDLYKGEIKGFESLVRWQHPTRGIILPSEFISLAEETGLIVPLGEWVIEESCRQLREWQTTFPMISPLTMSVNLSCKQFNQVNLVERIAQILEATEIERGTLRLEITESYLMEDSDAAISLLSRLRALGIKLSIDDFGTGYSSLSYLPRLPINYLKIDRSFISQMQNKPENREIVRTILLLARNLDLEVIAEGVETIEQAQYLRSFNCSFGQGYFYSKPVAAEQAGHLINSNFSVNLPDPKSSSLILKFIDD